MPGLRLGLRRHSSVVSSVLCGCGAVVLLRERGRGARAMERAALNAQYGRDGDGGTSKRQPLSPQRRYAPAWPPQHLQVPPPPLSLPLLPSDGSPLAVDVDGATLQHHVDARKRQPLDLADLAGHQAILLVAAVQVAPPVELPVQADGSPDGRRGAGGHLAEDDLCGGGGEKGGGCREGCVGRRLAAFLPLGNLALFGRQLTRRRSPCRSPSASTSLARPSRPHAARASKGRPRGSGAGKFAFAPSAPCRAATSRRGASPPRAPRRAAPRARRPTAFGGGCHGEQRWVRFGVDVS